jgi:N-acetylglutamate synthase-like GNAT family acetyltransferase
MKVRCPETPSDFERYFALRYEVLRKPWNQPIGSERDELEESSQHAMIESNSGEILGVCRMQFNNPEEAQLRYMGIRADTQGRGAGKMLMDYFEVGAHKQGCKRIVLQAREKAINFYVRNGYKILEKSYLMWGEIQHYKMEKQLS